MEIVYRNRVRDILWFTAYITFRFRSSFLVFPIILVIIVGPQVCVWLTQGMSPSGTLYLIQQILAITFNLLIAVLVLFGASILYSAIVSTRADSRIRASPDGMLCESWRDHRQVEWAQIKAMGQSEHHIWIFVSAYRRYLIPKRAFALETDAAKFYDYCHEHWQLATQASATMAPGATSPEFPPRKKRSRLGILSLVMAIIMPIPLAIIPATTAMGVEFGGTVSMVVGLLTFLGIICSIIGVALGLIALFQKNTNKVTPIMGILINLFFLLFVGSVVLSMMR